MHQEILLLLRKLDLAIDTTVLYSDDFKDEDNDLDCILVSSEGVRAIKVLEHCIERLDHYLGNDDDYYKQIIEDVDPSIEVPTGTDFREKLEEIHEDLSKIMRDYKVDTEHLGELRGVKQTSLLVESDFIPELQEYQKSSPIMTLLKFLG